MKVIVKDHIIDTSLIKSMDIWGKHCYNKESNDSLDEIGVFISYYKDRLIEQSSDLIITGYESNDIENNRKAIDEARSIVEFLNSHIEKPNYPVFE